jgi:hypothetical protein
MVANASANPKYQLKFVGNPRTDEAKMKSLASAGPLLAAKEQVLAALLPDAWGREEHAPDVAIPMGDIHSIMLPGTLLDSTSAKQGLHMAVEPGRLASLMQALDDAGMDWTPIRGSASEAVPKATARVTAALPSRCRTTSAPSQPSTSCMMVMQTTPLQTLGTTGCVRTCSWREAEAWRP